MFSSLSTYSRLCLECNIYIFIQRYVELLGQDDPIFVRTTAENSFRHFNTVRITPI